MPSRLLLKAFVVAVFALFLVPGTIWGQDNNIQQQTQPSKKSELLWQDLHNLKTIDSGSENAPEVFVVVDPLCPHCADYWQDLQASLQQGAKMRVRLIVVGILSCESLTIAQQIYAADNGLEAWNKVHQPENDPGLRLPTPASGDIVKQNHQFIVKWQQTTVPWTIYKDKNGQVQMIRARPDSVQIVMQNLKTDN